MNTIYSRYKLNKNKKYYKIIKMTHGTYTVVVDEAYIIHLYFELPIRYYKGANDEIQQILFNHILTFYRIIP